jgi:multidrug efflux pump subunit AcrA (membrane-fusion protein)
MKRNVLIIIAIVVIVAIVAGVFGMRLLTANASTTTTALQTTTVTRGTLVATVSAAGNVSAPTSVALAFQTSGRVIKVNAQVGDVVKKNQLLMQLDTTDLDIALKSAQINLASAQASYDAAKIKNDQNPYQVTLAKTTLDKAAITLQKAQLDYNVVAGNNNESSSSQAQTLAAAASDYQSALANYKITVSTINDTALKQAQASLDSAKIAVEQAQRNLEKAKIAAPFDGMIAAVNFSLGDSAGTGTAMTLIDTTQLQVKVNLAEVDIAKVKVGQTAQMTLDALTGKTFNAKVLTIAPSATISQGVVNYPVTVSVIDNDGSIKSGMTANLAIVVEQRDNVLLVPIRAIKTQGNQRTVTVVVDGNNVVQPVTIGMSNDTSAEITSNNLKEGDKIVINQATTRSTGGGGGGGGFGIPGIGRPD